MQVSEAKKQKLFRFDSELSDKLAMYARREGCSENAYVERMLKSAFSRSEVLPKIPELFGRPEWIERIAERIKGCVTPDDLEKDERLKYLIER